MVSLDKIREGSKVKIIGVERFKSKDSEIYEIFKELFIGREGKVVSIDKLNDIIWVELDLGARVRFNPQDLEEIKDA